MLLKPGNMASFNDVPDRVPPIGAGTYLFLVTDESVKPNRDNPTKTQPSPDLSQGSNLVISAVVDGPGPDNPMKGKRLMHYIGLPDASDSYDEKVSKLVRVKQFFVACGVPVEVDGEFDTSKLKGCHFNAEAAPRLYTDQGGVQRESSNITNILKPDGSRF